MTTRPSTQRWLSTPPPPSRALLNLQKQGLELSASQSQTSLYSTSSHVSGKSGASDRDKPLPLEPSEKKKRRSSSVYSTDTTITNIIRMYNDYKELVESPGLPTANQIHHPHDYRDTIAPLLIKRLSISKSPVPQIPAFPDPSDSTSNLSVRSAPVQAVTAQSGNITAPSFMEFSRSLQQRKNELASPSSVASTDPRQVAYDQLAPPSPQVSSVEMSLSISRTPPLLDAMTASISDVEESDLLPPPLGMSSSGPPSPVSDEWEEESEAQSPRSKGTTNDQSDVGTSGKQYSGEWLEDGIFQSPVSGSNKPWEKTSFRLRKSAAEKEQERILSYAAAKYPAMNGNAASRKRSRNSSARSSSQQGVSSLLRSVSRTKEKADPVQEESFPERPLAKPATPYQVYGPEIWSEKTKKKQQRQQQQFQHGHNRSKSRELVNAYQNGQSQFVGVIEKLTRRTSQKRRRKLKQSIVLVGPEVKKGKNDASKRPDEEDGASWI
ncbi:hypothetical protein EDD37DRAFT_281015 [Exophiala viscosa]|uniref:uncharacterized protein n=1 Tax=Exophiala viscosa TaxID=2486360 RepID=UPI0021924950|nr:hypothetical protein EDD37DRAFT_281015 [Exophiala viscosa]